MMDEVDVKHLPRWKRYLVGSNGTPAQLTTANHKQASFEIRIPMQPIPYRLKWGKRGPYNARAAEKRVAEQWVRAQYVGLPIDGPLHIEYLFFMGFSQKWGKEKREKLEKEDMGHFSTPDVDNLMKFYNDCIKGIVVEDDDRITCSGEKLYSPFPSVLALIRQKKEEA